MPTKTLLSFLLVLSCAIGPLAYSRTPQNATTAEANPCPFVGGGGGYLYLEPVPGFRAWIPEEVSQEMGALSPPALLQRFSQLKEYVRTHNGPGSNASSAARIQLKKLELVSILSVVKNRGLAESNDFDEVLSLLLTEPAMPACVSINLKSVRKFGELDKGLKGLRDSSKSGGCNLSLVSAGEVALGLLEATPAVGEQQAPIGRGQPISRIFYPLPGGTLFNTNLRYEIEMQVGPSTLQRDFDLKVPAKAKQAILENGVLQYQEWNYVLTPRHKFDKQDLNFSAIATASVVDPQTKLPVRSQTGPIPVPLKNVKLIPKAEGVWVYVGEFLDWGNKWFGFVGWLPALWGLYDLIRRFRDWLQKAPTGSASSTNGN